MPEIRMMNMARPRLPISTEVDGISKEPAPCAGRKDFVTGQHSAKYAADLVRKFCARCPIREGCLQWALAEQWFVGIAGGAFFKETGGYKGRRMVWPHLEYTKETNE